MKLKVIACIVSCCCAASASFAQTLVRSVNGPAANANFGKACIVVADQNADGYKDLLVGAPGFNQQRGAIYCVSGRYLAFGTGAQTLWSLAPTANQGDLFGYAIADVGDVNADGVDDFVVGQPGYDTTTANDVGAVRLVNGASHAVLSLRFGQRSSTDPGIGYLFGSAIAAIGDSSNDGKPEVAVGAPGNGGYVTVILSQDIGGSGTSFLTTQNSLYGSGNEAFGASIASGFDIHGDGFLEFVVGRPGYDGPSATDAGNCALFTRVPGGLFGLGGYASTIAGERLGSSVDAKHDYDGDGFADIVVGAPNSPDANNAAGGRVLVLSSVRISNDTPPFEIRELKAGFTSQTTIAGVRFGTAVSACADITGDGIGDVLVGAPSYSTIFPQNSVPGRLVVFSGATGTRWGFSTGAVDDVLGDAIAGAVNDLDGDGFKEFVAAGSLSNAGGTDSGVVKCYRLFPVAPAVYCTSKVNSLGCSPAIAFTGTPSESSGQPFLITGSSFLNQKNGLLFYSRAPISVAFQGGFKCAANPTVRTPNQSSGGASSGSSCTGAYSFDFNAWIATGWDASLASGSEIYAQWWSRDPQAASHTSLSNALRFLVQP